MRIAFARNAALAALLSATACAGRTTPLAAPDLALPRALANAKIHEPALISINTLTSELIYWPTAHGPSQHPITLSAPLGTYNGYSMAGNGSTIVIANYNPPEILTYDVVTKATATLSDPYGSPYDVAVGTDGSIYAMNAASVTVFPPDPSNPQELTCSYVTQAQSIAVDNEGDVFLDGYGKGNPSGIVEFPAGTSACKRLNLRPWRGYIGGIGIDPKTDDLIAVNNPGTCAGGLEGRMLIYPKPYTKKNARRHNLHAQYCAGGFRLDATSKHIYVSDATVSAGYPLIDVRSYPAGKGNGNYGSNYTIYTGGFTTIPRHASGIKVQRSGLRR